MIEKNGDIFNTDATYIGHGVNVEGLMGSGIAVQFKNRFPEMHAGYVARCADDRLQPGGFWCGTGIHDGRTVVIVNLASQSFPGKFAQYGWLFEAVSEFAKAASSPMRLSLYGGKVALPEIGCGIGGLEWPKVKTLLEAVEVLYPDIEFEVWHYAG